jgi:type III restriction enzyme
LRIIDDKTDNNGRRTVTVEGTAYVESDTALVNRVFKEVGGKQNILVLNDEAHHAYRIRRAELEADAGDGESGDDNGMGDADYFVKEATVWVDGLDRMNKLRGINFCVDLSATPYFIGRAGIATNTIFPWVVSDFGLTDAIEAGLVKIPSGAAVNAEGQHGFWDFAMVRRVGDVRAAIDFAAPALAPETNLDNQGYSRSRSMASSGLSAGGIG